MQPNMSLISSIQWFENQYNNIEYIKPAKSLFCDTNPWHVTPVTVYCILYTVGNDYLYVTV